MGMDRDLDTSSQVNQQGMSGVKWDNHNPQPKNLLGKLKIPNCPPTGGRTTCASCGTKAPSILTLHLCL